MTTPPAERPAPVGTFAPLSVPLYRRIWGTSVVSNVGTFLQLTAGPWLMNELTGSPLMVSLVTTALTLPRLLLTIPSGVLADAFDRRTIMIVGNGVGAVATSAMAFLATTDRMTPLWLLSLTFLLGVGSAITLPAQQTMMPDLVGPSLRPQAITLNSATFNVARAVGPSIGGILVGAGLTAAAFGANAATFVLVVGVLIGFPRQPVEDVAAPLLRSAALGMRYVRFTRPIRVLIVVTTLFMLTAASVQTLLPNVASDDLQVGPTGFGILYGLLGVGALCAVTLRERARLRLGRHMLPGAVLLFGTCAVAFGLAPSPLLAGGAILLCGVGWVWTLVTLNASIQTLAPRWVRSRVVSMYLLAIGVQPFGAALAGALAEAAGPSDAVAILNGCTVVLGLLLFRLDLPVLGEIDEPMPADDQTVRRHAVEVAGTPVIVTTTWEVDPDQVEAFLEVMRDVRRTRLRTGAHRWSLFRDADRPHRITEFMVLADWDEHLAQHARLDAEAAAILRRAREFDVGGAPITRHLAGLDITRRAAAPIAEQLLTVHQQLHATDGSTPLEPPTRTS